jgi:hypothetical protein
MHIRALFILKNQLDYSHGYGTKKSSGLRNSAQFVSDMLVAAGVPSKVVIVTDNNDIDREVTQFQASHVFIEALWVVPEKFDILVTLHPNVKWIVRIHSEIPFLAQDGIAVDWIKKYVAHPNVFVAANSGRAVRDLNVFADCKVIYLPNFYPAHFAKPRKFSFPKHILNISCFGAIRPLKDQLIQAIAAVQFANNFRLALNFHINATRVEQGEGILKNLRSLFANSEHQLIEHEWQAHSDFLKTIRGMDLALSVSFSETFSITTADAVAQAVPVVTSPEIVWSSRRSQADPTDSADIVDKIYDAFKKHDKLISMNQAGLSLFSNEAREIWLIFLSHKRKRSWWAN